MRLLFLFLLVFGFGVAHASPDKDFLAAREAYKKGHYDQFLTLAHKVPADYLLQPYLKYWRMQADSPTPEDLAHFIKEYPRSPLSEYLRTDLALRAAKVEDWGSFINWASRLAKPDIEVRCDTFLAAMDSGVPPPAKAVLPIYHDAGDLPSSCENLFVLLEAGGIVDKGERYKRMRAALNIGNLRLAREMDAGLPDEERMERGALKKARRHPESLVKEGSTRRGQREAALYALTLIARNDPQAAATLWERAQDKYTDDERVYGWGQIAMYAARQDDPQALEWFDRAGDRLSDAQIAWKVRADLRAGRWNQVYKTIEDMPEDLRDKPVWQYWEARALEARNHIAEANAIFARLSRGTSYYGLLSAEELPVTIQSQPEDYSLKEADMDAVSKLPGIQRALLLRKLGLMVDAVLEWKWALRDADDVDLLAAAEIARREEWYDRSIITAERTREKHNFDLRYITPYRDLAHTYAQENGLDEAWVYGLIRQESRFVHFARSGSGARGLMQIMPATGRWIARQLGVNVHKARAALGKPETNIRFGTYYLRHMLDSLQDSTVLATAGYNAGPNRARRWQADVPLEGAIYIETIPYTETREYVKKVMTNALYYSQRLGMDQTDFKDLLGIVPARPQTTQAVSTDDSKDKGTS